MTRSTANPLPPPTDAELEILRALWQRGASTVREIHDDLSATKTVGYTTVLKQMQVMRRKGLVKDRNASARMCTRRPGRGRRPSARLSRRCWPRCSTGRRAGCCKARWPGGRSMPTSCARFASFSMSTNGGRNDGPRSRTSVGFGYLPRWGPQSSRLCWQRHACGARPSGPRPASRRRRVARGVPGRGRGCAAGPDGRRRWAGAGSISSDAFETGRGRR